MNVIIPNNVSLDSVEYDPVAHLNILFSHPSSVISVTRVSSKLQQHEDGLARSISSLENAQAYGPDSSLERMQSAQAELASLFQRIESVRSRALQTERDITTMTADIKRLDGTKRNLTLSMTALKRLQMLTTAYEQLRGLARTRQYRECAGLLQAVLQLMRHFHSYRSIEQIAVLSRGVGELQRELLEQVCEDFELAFAKGEVAARRPVLSEACQVMDALGDGARARLVTWYVNTELREYRSVFRGNDEAGSLDNIGRRYAWFRRTLKTHEDEHAAIFPPHWRVNETLATAFCDGTRDDFKSILEKSMRSSTAGGGGKIDVNLLLSCLQETMDFEQSLERRFSSQQREQQSRASIDTLSSADDRQHTLNGSISVAFEPYLSLWVESQDRQLAMMIPKYKQQPLVAEDEEFNPQGVIPSAIELFHFYKLTLSQCAKLSTGERLLDLAKTLARYLDEYAQQVLLTFLQRGGPQGPAVQDIVLVLNTADFWHTNTNQLEDNIKRRIDTEMVSKVDLSSQSDAFMGVASAAVLAMVHKVEVDCEGAWREMKNTNWSRLEAVSDHSSYVVELLKHINAKAAEILPLVTKQQYARAFCDNLVEHMASTYINNVVQCKPVCETAAEQMLLDKYVLTKAFENLLSFHTPPSSSSSQPATPTTSGYTPPAGFVKRVNQSMTRIDPLLKTLQVRPSPPEGLVQAYLIHIADRSDTNFRKILDLKGVRKQDQPHLMELFVIHRDSHTFASGKLVQSSPLLTPLMMTSGLGSNTGGLVANNPVVAATATGLQTARFDAASLGEKLLNAAREMGTNTNTPITPGGTGGGGGGLGIGIGGGLGGGSSSGGVGGAGGGGGGEKGLNENLKNIGKFFRRDIAGGLGARFGKRDITPTGGGGGGPTEPS
ncbi:vacuolar protein sorting-associated protein 53 [Diplogelasinospora grovesii]|uniref:Vacuolar protein sorting-associated protein 53 n=1 Tax=Diplogelasinospora grovesii TaxID=303347 RepID=A0AAN6S5C5_9PEZI|nr:vacuolar protein sorting-associated protein 53 [Diplogelasinospora grovesii]